MLRIKRAAELMMPLALLCSVATAQQQPDSPRKSAAPTQLKAQTQTPPPPKTRRRQQVSVRHGARTQKTAPVQNAIIDVLPAACATPAYVVPPGDVYGAYVPYVGPAQPTACATPSTQAARSSSPLPNSSAVQKQQPDSLIKSISLNLPASNDAAQKQQPDNLIKSISLNLAQPATNLAQPASNDLALASNAATDGSPAGTGYVRPVPLHRAATIPQEIRPFRSLAIGFKADTLGLGVEFATPMAYRINLRSSINFFAFNYPFNIDGVNYNARLHFKSSETTVDWFPRGEGGFHISPGILYVKNTLSAPASVGPGQTFVLGSQAFINSVDDPVNGTSSVVYSRKFAPMLLLGYGNIIRFRSKLAQPTPAPLKSALPSTGPHAPPTAVSTSPQTPRRRTF
jgi:hypothetical protein